MHTDDMQPYLGEGYASALIAECESRQLFSAWHAHSECCSEQCEMLCRRDLARVRCLDQVSFCPPILGRRAPSSARCLQAALERNATVARQHRANRLADLRHIPREPAGGIEDVAAERQIIVDAINIDVGIVFAATIADQLPPDRRSRRQRLSGADWRIQYTLYKNILKTVANIYYKHRLDGGIVTSVMTPRHWLQKVKDSAMHIF